MVRARPLRLRTGTLVALLGAGAVLAGCGGDDPSPSASATTTTPTTTQQAPSTTAPSTTIPAPSADELRAERRAFPDLPPLREVPQTATDPADAGDRKVAEQWFDLVRRGQDEKAAGLMADGARFSNFDVLLVKNRAARVAVAGSLPCGATPVSVGGAEGGYVVLTLKLTDKAGEAPCDGAGAPVAVALHVEDGKIDDWVRVQADDAPINRGAPV
ncbi:hypothetical protein [Patulibacter sp.]|uniref:hypothetical protein n=1 Tax=Patulibacter sp. TaxID=1912859 RepID=UPI0027211C37|nr:hypothetical protein [Patulibacter sp.]MDO9408100.1 hypothetical protein [Patulibacter sp.]